MTWVQLIFGATLAVVALFVCTVGLLASLALALRSAIGCNKPSSPAGNSLHPMANALKVLTGVDKAFDDRISALIERSKQIEARNKAAAGPAPERPNYNRQKTVQEQLDELVGGPSIIQEQPDAEPEPDPMAALDEDMETVT